MRDADADPDADVAALYESLLYGLETWDAAKLVLRSVLEDAQLV